MFRYFRIWTLAVLAGLACNPASSADQLEQIRSSGKIRVAIINGLPSFSQLDARSGWTGSDADTARLLARDLGVKAEFVPVANAARINALLENRADVIISALSITPEREQQISFSLPYSVIALVIGAHPLETINGYRDLNGKRVGVGRNTSDGMLLKQNAKSAQIIEFDDEAALLKGFVDQKFGIISCQRASITLLNERLPPQLQIEEKFIQREFQVAIGMRKDAPALRQWVNAWISKSLLNGQLNDIFRRHHGRSLPDSVLPTPQRLSLNGFP